MNMKINMKTQIRSFIVAGLIVSIFLAFFISPFASQSPDGLEKVAEKQDFLKLGDTLVWKYSPLGIGEAKPLSITRMPATHFVPQRIRNKISHATIPFPKANSITAISNCVWWRIPIDVPEL